MSSDLDDGEDWMMDRHTKFRKAHREGKPRLPTIYLNDSQVVMLDKLALRYGSKTKAILVSMENEAGRLAVIAEDGA